MPSTALYCSCGRKYQSPLAAQWGVCAFCDLSAELAAYGPEDDNHSKVNAYNDRWEVPIFWTAVVLLCITIWIAALMTVNALAFQIAQVIA